MFTVRSIRGDWMRTVAKNAFPQKSTRGRIEALAEALKISRRSCYAYVAEERRVPEEVEQRFIALFGDVADDGWRTIDLYRFRTPAKDKVKKKRGPGVGGMTKEKAAELRGSWLEQAQRAASILSQDLLGHKLEWTEAKITYGQLAMIEHDLDEEEARRKHPNNFDVPAPTDEIVAYCQLCDLVGAVDVTVKEVNGMIFNVTCRSYSYKVGE